MNNKCSQNGTKTINKEKLPNNQREGGSHLPTVADPSKRSKRVTDLYWISVKIYNHRAQQVKDIRGMSVTMLVSGYKEIYHLKEEVIWRTLNSQYLYQFLRLLVQDHHWGLLQEVAQRMSNSNQVLGKYWINSSLLKKMKNFLSFK